MHMGVETRIVLYAGAEERAAEAARAAFARVAVLDSLLSDYRADSELNRLVAGAGGPPKPVSEEFFHVLSRSQALAALSDGRFDATAGPLVRLWRQARRSGELPTEAARAEAASRVGWRHLELDPAARTARLALPGMQLDLGGIAKGYAADEAIATLRRAGIRSALVEMGGDIVVSEAPPGQRGWRVQVSNAPPAERSVLAVNIAVSSSGDTEQFVVIDGVRYSHVVDLRTGLGLRSRAAATVVAADGITADALSTLATLMEPGEANAWFATHFPSATVYLRQANGDSPPEGAARTEHN
jgi:FAD:protein FMN transferase